MSFTDLTPEQVAALGHPDVGAAQTIAIAMPEIARGFMDSPDKHDRLIYLSSLVAGYATAAAVALELGPRDAWVAAGAFIFAMADHKMICMCDDCQKQAAEAATPLSESLPVLAALHMNLPEGPGDEGEE